MSEKLERLFFAGASSDGESSDDNGVYCDVNLETLISELIVAPYAARWFVDLVKSLAERHGVADRVHKSALAESPRFDVHIIGLKRGD